MFPVSICEEQGLVYPVCYWKRKQNCLSDLIGFFGMLFSSVSIREAVLIHSGNLMKSSPFSLTPGKSSSQNRAEKVRRQWVNHWSISTESFLPNISFFVFHSDFWLPLLTVETCKSQEFSSRSCGLDWDREGSSDYNSPHPQAACGIRKFADIPHPYFGVMDYNKQQLDCESASSSHSGSSMPFPGVGTIQRKSGTNIELTFLRQIAAFSWLSYSSSPKPLHRYSSTEKEEIDRRRKRRQTIITYSR